MVQGRQNQEFFPGTLVKLRSRYGTIPVYSDLQMIDFVGYKDIQSTPDAWFIIANIGESVCVMDCAGVCGWIWKAHFCML